MSEPDYNVKRFPWLAAGALFFFFAALTGFVSGVSVTERPSVGTADLLTQSYYSLSLFVVGGVDLGTPQGGPLPGRVLLWTAYFGAPILTASTLIGALWQAIAPQSWKLRRLNHHVVIVGAEELSLSYLRALRRHCPHVPVVVVSRSETQQSMKDEFQQGLGATVVVGDITHEFFLKQLHLERARKILLLSNDSLRSYEAASSLLKVVPQIGERIVIHCDRLRFMRAMENTLVAQRCETFNTYHLAAAGLVRDRMLQQFRETQEKDAVIIAGFGRFGQTILEELQRNAPDELATIAIIEKDAHRRVMVAEEQMAFTHGYSRKVFDGDISHPEVWQQMQAEVELKADGRNSIFVLGTGMEEDNLRTALWIKRKYPQAMVIARSSRESHFATEVAAEHNFISISINQLVEENIPAAWVQLSD
ncbi:MAG: NAD-binding protein [Pseudomonadales bacterium]|jgi:voltage-gated potassium channel Kch|nr:NAD-binding protein [Pseudomonadales bacterium]